MFDRRAVVHASWLPNYLQAFGLAGLSLLYRVARTARSTDAEPMPVAVHGLGTIWLRGPAHDHTIFQQVWVKREYDLATIAPDRWKALTEAYAGMERPVILDAGAHIGMSVLWWKRMLPRAQIIALEPSLANFAVLQRNLAGIEGVHTLHAALAARPGTVRIEAPNSGDSATRTRIDGEGEAIRAVTVDEIMADFGVRDFLLVKMDIEGAEEEVFSGPREWLDCTHVVSIETHDWLWPGRATSRTLWAAVGERRFDVLTSGENTWLFRCPAPSPNRASG
jgi:FkbM family methyltransferase